MDRETAFFELTATSLIRRKLLVVLRRRWAGRSWRTTGRAYNEDGNLPEDGLRLVIEEAKKVTKLDREIPLSDVADLSILRETQKELSIKEGQ